jgi:HD superfamily phosphohydrolase
MTYKPQRIRDPLHNLIEFHADEFENAMWDVMNTRPFQRLRRIKQLGFSDLVYPGATHSRFAHSVGVFHTARQLMKVVFHYLGTRDFKESVAKKALAAALVHDVGHGPFSHAFEGVGKRLGLKMAIHENVSDAIIRNSEISEVLKSKLGGGFSDDVANLIGKKTPPNIYSAVVSSQFDADRLDYMQRDRLMSGTQNAMIDFKWLMANLLVDKVKVGVDDKATGEVETFVLGPKAFYAAESYVLGLFQLYPTVYFHKATRGAEKIFEELLCRVVTLIRDGKLENTSLQKNHPLAKLAANPDDLETVLSLDDTVMWGTIHELTNAKDAYLKDLAIRLRDRKLYKSIDIREKLKSIIPDAVKDRDTKIDKACITIREKINAWTAEKSKDISRILIDEASRSPYNKLSESKGPINQIHIQDSKGGLIDLDKHSDVVRALQEFRFFRAYFPSDDSEAKKFIESTVDQEAKNVDKN